MSKGRDNRIFSAGVVYGLALGLGVMFLAAMCAPARAEPGDCAPRVEMLKTFKDKGMTPHGLGRGMMENWPATIEVFAHPRKRHFAIIATTPLTGQACILAEGGELRLRSLSDGRTA